MTRRKTLDPVTIDCIDGRHFILRIDGHHITVPADQPKLIVRMLLARNARKERARIGSDISNPVQDMVNAWLASNEANVNVRKEQERIEQARAKFGALFDEVEI